MSLRDDEPTSLPPLSMMKLSSLGFVNAFVIRSSEGGPRVNSLGLSLDDI